MTDSPDRGSQRPGRRDDSPRQNRGPHAGRPTGSDRPNRQGGSERPARDGDRPQRDRPVRGGRPDRGADRKLWTSGGKPARNDRDARSREVELSEEEKQARALRAVRPRHDDPEIPDGVTARDLDKGARNELKTLSKENAEGVAQHLAMAARLIESDPELAHRHAISAARRAGRIGIVRETLAITAYATGDFALAIRELRTYRRISGSNEQLALMVDSERGVGRPDRALEVGRSVQRSELSSPAQVAVAIAMSGARLDLGQTEAALDELDIPQLNPDVAYSYSADLFSAYADVLEDLGRVDEAESWRERAARADAALGDDDGDLVEVYEEDIVFDSVDDVIADAAQGSLSEESGDEPVRPSES
ncbi:hypothetical protein SAMN06295879_2604 [Agreia bicolorata]|uniref:Primosomal protein n=1 Tax=Agreia bicolorata TaxID=110935 RepID=A0A1T4YC73_9MICO|nr:hypothetical protein [Agreia bicolorata]SKA98855.1 hypothetical protein SAMN06295879_2604 [Agreia bicolorata]